MSASWSGRRPRAGRSRVGAEAGVSTASRCLVTPLRAARCFRTRPGSIASGFGRNLAIGSPGVECMITDLEGKTYPEPVFFNYEISRELTNSPTGAKFHTEERYVTPLAAEVRRQVKDVQSD